MLSPAPAVNAVNGGHPLPAEVPAFFERRFHADFSRVRVHSDMTADTAARAVDALAYTRGNDIVFRAGRYDPVTTIAVICSRAGRHVSCHHVPNQKEKDMKRLIFAAVILVSPVLAAQPVAIPTLQVCNAGKVNGSANLYFSRRDDINTAGTIDITVSNVSCDPQSSSPYPTGTITMRFSLTESSVSDVEVTLVEQMTTVGKHTPTSYMNGRCTANGGTIPCHFWLMFADNKVLSIDTPADVIGVLVVDRLGNRLAYGTGPIRTGDISITPY